MRPRTAGVNIFEVETGFFGTFSENILTGIEREERGTPTHAPSIGQISSDSDGNLSGTYPTVEWGEVTFEFDSPTMIT